MIIKHIIQIGLSDFEEKLNTIYALRAQKCKKQTLLFSDIIPISENLIQNSLHNV